VGGEFALLTGLAVGTRFSMGSPTGNDGWRLPAGDLTRAFAIAPQNFVGVMQAAVDLRSGNDTLIDSQVMRLEWMPKPIDIAARPPPPRDGDTVKPAAAAAAAPAPPLDPEELAILVRRGQDFIKTGDLAAARLVLRRAVTTDDAQAALALATTFDPLVFAELGVLGFQPDLAQARSWYERAAQLGSQEAQRRLARLARLPP
jgi:TPR repeat protein